MKRHTHYRGPSIAVDDDEVGDPVVAEEELPQPTTSKEWEEHLFGWHDETRIWPGLEAHRHDSLHRDHADQLDPEWMVDLRKRAMQREEPLQRMARGAR